MRATKGYVAGVGTTSALLGAIGCAFAILSAVVAVHGWPLTLGSPGVATVDGGGAAAGPAAAFAWPAGPLFGGVRAGARGGALPASARAASRWWRRRRSVRPGGRAPARWWRAWTRAGRGGRGRRRHAGGAAHGPAVRGGSGGGPGGGSGGGPGGGSGGTPRRWKR